MTISLQMVIEEASKNKRVCPLPMKWNELYEMLPEKTRKGYGWKPSLPLILGGWWHSSDLDKMDRLKEHLLWAEKHNCLDKIYEFLYGLKEEEWHHIGDSF